MANSAQHHRGKASEGKTRTSNKNCEIAEKIATDIQHDRTAFHEPVEEFLDLMNEEDIVGERFWRGIEAQFPNQGRNKNA